MLWRREILSKDIILEVLRNTRERAIARARAAGKRDRAFMEQVKALMKIAWEEMDRAHTHLQEVLRMLVEAGFLANSEWVITVKEAMFRLAGAQGHLLMFLRRKGVVV